MAEYGNGGAYRIDGEGDETAFEEESVDAKVDVILVIPEADTPIDGGSDAIEGKDSPSIEHADAEGAGVAGVDGLGASFGPVEENVEATCLCIEERLKVVESGYIFGFFIYYFNHHLVV